MARSSAYNQQIELLLIQVPFLMCLKVICDGLKAIFAKIPLSQQMRQIELRGNIVIFGFFFSIYSTAFNTLSTG